MRKVNLSIGNQKTLVWEGPYKPSSPGQLIETTSIGVAITHYSEIVEDEVQLDNLYYNGKHIQDLKKNE